MSERFQPARLALREEGEYLIAYYAAPNTMENAWNIGSIHTSIAAEAGAKALFIEFVEIVVSGITAAQYGDKPNYPAPRQKRAGHG